MRTQQLHHALSSSVRRMAQEFWSYCKVGMQTE